jgi:excisionase family DNA binding protein
VAPVPSFIVPEHLAVTPDVARSLVALLAPGRAQARKNGYLLHDDRLATFLLELDRLAEHGRTRPDLRTVTEHRPVWLTTAEAARRLGVSDRRVRDMHLTGKRVGREWRWLEADVEAEADARLDR